MTVRIPDLSLDENALINGLLDDIQRLRLSNMLRTSYYDNKRTIRMVGTLSRRNTSTSVWWSGGAAKVWTHWRAAATSRASCGATGI